MAEVNRARLMREVLDGETSGKLSIRENVPLHLMSGRIASARASINAFLAESPLMQGLLRAKGELLIQWHEEVTTAMLNSGERFVVVLPYGAFTISCKRDRSRDDNDSIQVQAGRRVNGKPVNRSCSCAGGWGKNRFPYAPFLPPFILLFDKLGREHLSPIRPLAPKTSTHN